MASKAIAAFAMAAAMSTAAAAADLRVIDAARNDRAADLRALVQQHVDVNVHEADGTTALHWAVRADDLEAARLLVRAGASVNATNRYGVMPLSLAAKNGNAAMVRVLLDAGADPSAASPEGETVLMTAAKTGDPATVRMLLDAGADVDACEQWLHETALMWAAAENHADATRVLLEYGAEIDARSMQQVFAPFRFNLATMVNTVLPRGHLTALMMAAREGAVASERVLIAHHADVNLTDPDGVSPLVMAILNGHYDAAALLLDNGANPNIADSAGMAAVYATVDMHTQPLMINRPTRKPSGRLETLDFLKQLLAHGGDPDAPLAGVLLARYHNTGDRDLGAGSTPLMRAAKSLDVAAMRVLLEAGADVTRTNRAGATAVMFAAGMGRTAASHDAEPAALEAVQLCLEYGADVRAKNAAGQTAMQIAATRSDAVAKLLAVH